MIDLTEKFTVTINGIDYEYTFKGLKAKLIWEEVWKANKRPRLFTLEDTQDWTLYFYCILVCNSGYEASYEEFVNNVQDDDLAKFINNHISVFSKGITKSESDEEVKK